mmetsp:Transcript_35771/g.91343  ORF Transcript_35771/g.91343 Transcript_35771/m.91343 type:complete len:163 (-) Transcript_35771:226-714(-)
MCKSAGLPRPLSALRPTPRAGKHLPPPRADGKQGGHGPDAEQLHLVECELSAGQSFLDSLERTLSSSSDTLSEASFASMASTIEEEEEDKVLVRTSNFPKGIFVKIVTDGEDSYGKGKFQSQTTGESEALWIKAKASTRRESGTAQWRREVGKSMGSTDLMC